MSLCRPSAFEKASSRGTWGACRTSRFNSYTFRDGLSGFPVLLHPFWMAEDNKLPSRCLEVWQRLKKVIYFQAATGKPVGSRLYYRCVNDDHFGVSGSKLFETRVFHVWGQGKCKGFHGRLFLDYNLFHVVMNDKTLPLSYSVSKCQRLSKIGVLFPLNSSTK